MLLASLNAAPKAEVYEVEELVQKVWRGEMRIPDFQRPLRWGFEDARRLFDSILRGYPIGNLLLWARRAAATQVRLGAVAIDAPAMERALWVVDGQQRVTSLANALSETGLSDDRFALSVDLLDERVVRAVPGAPATVVPLPVLFDLQKLLRWFRDFPEVADHFDAATAIAKRIRQAQVSASVVEAQDEQVLRDIFDRVNNYGKRLTRAEVFSALHPQGGDGRTDSSTAIEDIAASIAENDEFGVVDGDTLLRAVLARRGADIGREIRIEFDTARRGASDFPGESVDEAYRLTAAALSDVVHFLQNHVGVPHFALLPYRHLLIVLVRVFAHHSIDNDRARQLLRRWFWRAASAGPAIFPGSTTGTTRALCTRVIPGDLDATLAGLLDAVPDKLLTHPDVRNFRTNHAAGKIIACSMWALEPRSVHDGRRLERRDLADTLGDSQTPRHALSAVVARSALADPINNSAARWLLLPGDAGAPAETAQLLADGSLLLEATEWQDVLRSHAIDETAAAEFAAGNAAEFVRRRSARLQDHLAAFLDSRWERGYESALSLDRYILDDLESDETLEFGGLTADGPQ